MRQYVSNRPFLRRLKNGSGKVSIKVRHCDGRHGQESKKILIFSVCCKLLWGQHRMISKVLDGNGVKQCSGLQSLNEFGLSESLGSDNSRYAVFGHVRM